MGSSVNVPPVSGRTARKSRSSNVSPRRVLKRRARTTTDRSAKPRSSASYWSSTLAAGPCSSAVRPSTGSGRQRRPARTRGRPRATAPADQVIRLRRHRCRHDEVAGLRGMDVAHRAVLAARGSSFASRGDMRCSPGRPSCSSWRARSRFHRRGAGRHGTRHGDAPARRALRRARDGILDTNVAGRQSVDRLRRRPGDTPEYRRRCPRCSRRDQALDGVPAEPTPIRG